MPRLSSLLANVKRVDVVYVFVRVCVFSCIYLSRNRMIRDIVKRTRFFHNLMLKQLFITNNNVIVSCCHVIATTNVQTEVPLYRCQYIAYRLDCAT